MGNINYDYYLQTGDFDDEITTVDTLPVPWHPLSRDSDTSLTRNVNFDILPINTLDNNLKLSFLNLCLHLQIIRTLPPNKPLTRCIHKSEIHIRRNTRTDINIQTSHLGRNIKSPRKMMSLNLNLQLLRFDNQRPMIILIKTFPSLHQPNPVPDL
jgi:hypothetical protein